MHKTLRSLVLLAGFAATIVACSDPSGARPNASIRPFTALSVTFTGPVKVNKPSSGFVEVNCQYQATASGGTPPYTHYGWELDGSVVTSGNPGLLTYSGPWPSHHSLDVYVVDSAHDTAWSIPKTINLVTSGGTNCQPS